MKTIIIGIFTVIISSTASLAGGCSKHNHDANLEAMACQAGYTWDSEAEACVEAPQA